MSDTKIEKRKELEIYMIVIDFEIAHEIRYGRMRILQINKKWIEMVQQSYSNNSGKVGYGSIYECALSTLLFNIYLYHILEKWPKNNLRLFH